MSKLSLCMIVKNESENLPRCLDSVKDVVDEMIVMDTGSEDDTIEIAKSYGAIVPIYEWQGHFSRARNVGLEYATGDWILVLDADEALNPAIVPRLRELMEDADNLAINFLRHEIGSQQSPYSLVSRFFRKHDRVKFTRPYHSIIDDTTAELLREEPRWKIIELTMVGILHYGYTPEAIESLNKTERARIAMEGFYRENPRDPYVCSKLGALYISIDREKEGLKLLKQGLKHHGSNPQTLYELHYHLGNAHVKLKDHARAIKHYQKALEQPISNPLKLGTYNNIGGLYQSLGDYNKAFQAFEMTLKIDPSFTMGYYNLGLVLTRLNRFIEAIKCYEKVIEILPDYAPAHQNLGVTLLKSGNYNDGIKAFKSAIKIYRQRGNIEEALEIEKGIREIGVSDI